MMANNVSKTFSIEPKIYEKFEQICDSKRVNKSKVLQDAIKNFIGENYDINKDMFYKLRHIENSEIVKIQSKDKDFIILSNGNKMNIFDFEMLYEEEDLGVKKVLNYFESTEDVDQVDPEQLFDGSCSLNPGMLKNAFEKVDITKVKDTRESVHYREITNDDVLIKDERTFDEKVAELKENIRLASTMSSEDYQNLPKMDINDVRNKVQNEEWIKKLKQKQFLDSLGTLKVETAAEEFLNQSSINPEKFREILETIDTEKIETIENNPNGPWSRRIVKENGEDIYNQSFKPIEKTTEISFDKNINIVNRIKEKFEIIKLLDLNDNLEDFSNILIYILDTKVIIEKFEDLYIVNVNEKYHNYLELDSLLNQKIQKFEYKNLEEIPINEQIKERISKINTSDFLNMSSKPTHMTEMLSKILKGIVPDGTLISVSYDEPLYTISIPEKYIYEELLDFIMTYGIKPEYIIFKDI